MDAETFERITAAKAKEKGSERIKLLNEDEVVAPASATGDGVREDKSKGKGKKGKMEGIVDDGQSVSAVPARIGKPITPKHEFEVLNSLEMDGRKRFIMVISLPDEVSAGTCRDQVFVKNANITLPLQPILAEQDMSGITLSLAHDHLDFSSHIYTLSTSLPRDVDVDSVLKSADGVEWSVEDKALRIQGVLE